MAAVVQPATHALNAELSQPCGVLEPLGERRFDSCRMMDAAAEAGGGNMEIDQADFHIPTATTTTTRMN